MNMRKPSKRKERAARRLLVYVQILHSPEDMGTLSGTLEEQFIQRFGAEGWKKRKEVTARL